LLLEAGVKIRDLARNPYMIRAIRKIVVPLFRLWFGTCRVELINGRVLDEYADLHTPVVVGTWHRATIFALYFFAKFHPMVMISQSKDGELLAQFAATLGILPVRGSSGRGGKGALMRMRQHLAQGGGACATVLDGPRGPAYVAKKGMLLLAQLSGALFIPVIWSASRALTVRNSWDKALIPLPWSRVYLALGDPIHIPPSCGSGELERYRELVERNLNDMMTAVDRRCGYGG
jgi:lysophospholipid acyltransferase (LPLAT)-like uncharacterized protein